MKKHLETIMQKKYSRKINSLNKEKEELSEKKGKLEFFQKLIEEHPALENAIKGMVQAKETLKRLKDEEARGIEPRFFGEDEECEEKLETNKKTLMDYFAKHSINITEKDLEDITSLEFTKGKDGRIDVKSSVKREISKTEKQIRSVDKNIANHKSALEKVNGRSKTEKPDKSKAKTEETERTETESSEKVSARSETERADESRAEIEETEKPESSEKPKWYQFVKRFKNWRERRKQSTLPSRDEEPTKEEPVEKTAKKDDGKKFRDSLKYDIVKDIVDKTERDELKQAKMERKKSEGRDR